MTDTNVYVVSVIETYERRLDLRVHADSDDEALEEAMAAYVDTNGAIGKWGDYEKTGIRVEMAK